MIPEFQYHIPWRVRSGPLGRHPSSANGGGFEYHGSVPFASQPDARHWDVRATLADPFGQLMVKRFRERAAVPVWLLADVSASMGFANKIGRLAAFAEALAWSASRSGDPFGCLVCDAQIRPELSFGLSARKGLDEWRGHFEQFQPHVGRHDGLLEAAWQLGRRRSLVFLVSDFHLPIEELEAVFQALSGHDVVPVVLWDSAEFEDLPKFGLVALQDPETGQVRRVLMRPALRKKISLQFAQRREALKRLCLAHGREPFFLTGAFEPDAMTRYFHPA
jgi:uncharacterized protein (DUF58 family)